MLQVTMQYNTIQNKYLQRAAPTVGATLYAFSCCIQLCRHFMWLCLQSGVSRSQRQNRNIDTGGILKLKVEK